MRRKHDCVLGGQCGTCRFCLPVVRLERAIQVLFASRDAMRDLPRDERWEAMTKLMRNVLPLTDVEELIREEMAR